jgi:menaquinone-9 beta-reductase
LRRAEKNIVTTTRVDHLVIGGGPAGSMVALRLAVAGRRVVLVEKEQAAHHKVCGEFLSREAVHYLRQIGIEPASLGAAAIRKVRLASKNKIVESALPFQALSLSRRVLDEALLARATENGCEVVRGAAVESLSAGGSGWTAQLSNGNALRSPVVFLATGKHDLRGWRRPPGKQNDLIGFKLHWQLAPAQIDALRECMDLFLFSGGYGGISLIENDTANLCLVVRGSVLRKLGAWPDLLAAILAQNQHLRRLLDGAKPLWPRPLAISPIPYGYLAAEPRGIWCIGDQAAVIPSFTGDGISIALHSAVLTAEMFLSGQSVAAFNETLRAQLRRSMILATWFSRTAVTSPGSAAALFAASLFPRAMQSIASSTRIPQAALIHSADLGAEPANTTPQSASNAPA